MTLFFSFRSMKTTSKTSSIWQVSMNKYHITAMHLIWYWILNQVFWIKKTILPSESCLFLEMAHDNGRLYGKICCLGIDLLLKMFQKGKTWYWISGYWEYQVIGNRLLILFFILWFTFYRKHEKISAIQLNVKYTILLILYSVMCIWNSKARNIPVEKN